MLPASFPHIVAFLNDIEKNWEKHTHTHIIPTFNKANTHHECSGSPDKSLECHFLLRIQHSFVDDLGRSFLILYREPRPRSSSCYPRAAGHQPRCHLGYVASSSRESISCGPWSGHPCTRVDFLSPCRGRGDRRGARCCRRCPCDEELSPLFWSLYLSSWQAPGVCPSNCVLLLPFLSISGDAAAGSAVLQAHFSIAAGAAAR